MAIEAKIVAHYYEHGVEVGETVEFEGKLCKVTKVEEVNAGASEVLVELKEIRKAIRR